MTELLSEIPVWVWVLGGFIGFVFVFGDSKLWELEAKFPLVEGVGRGSVEFECKKKAGTTIECEFDLAEEQRNKSMEIYVAGQLVFTVPQSANTGRFKLEEPLPQLQKPHEGAVVMVKLDGREVFSGPLVLD